MRLAEELRSRPITYCLWFLKTDLASSGTCGPLCDLPPQKASRESDDKADGELRQLDLRSALRKLRMSDSGASPKTARPPRLLLLPSPSSLSCAWAWREAQAQAERAEQAAEAPGEEAEGSGTDEDEDEAEAARTPS